MIRSKSLPISRLESPCKDCNDRRFKCHSECKKYLEFLEKNEKAREEKLERARQAEACYAGSLRRGQSLHSNGVNMKHGKSLKPKGKG